MNHAKATLVVNAVDSKMGEIRVAYLNPQLEKVFDQNDQTIISKGNIYLAKISSDVPSLEAYFVDYGEEKHGFLPYKETNGRQNQSEPTKLNMNEQLLVQINKEERGSKGAALTAEITIPGTFLVLMPKSEGVRGISKNIDEQARIQLEETIKNLNIPKEMGVIVRTSAKNRSREELEADLNYLLCVWQELEKSAKESSAPALIFQEHQGIHRIIKETVKSDLSKIVVDDEDTADLIRKYVKQIYPELLDNIVMHTSNVPIFTHYQIEDEIESMFSREVELQSGGRLVIDRTEAMYTIDVNSAQATNAKTVEKTALQTNLEAVRKTAQIMRLRELNGIIAIDLIDMLEENHKEAVLNEMRSCIADDKSRVSIVGGISELGVLQISRQRSKPSLSETHLEKCHTCNGRGYVRTASSFAYSLLRIIEQHAIHGKSSTLFVQAPLSIATYLCNEKYQRLRAIEKRQNVVIKIIPNPQLEIPKYLIKRVRAEDLPQTTLEPTIIEKDLSKSIAPKRQIKTAKITTEYLPQVPKKKTSVGLMQKILELFTSDTKTKPQPKTNRRPNRNKNHRRKQQNRKHTPNNRRGPNATSGNNRKPKETKQKTQESKA